MEKLRQSKSLTGNRFYIQKKHSLLNEFKTERKSSKIKTKRTQRKKKTQFQSFWSKLNSKKNNSIHMI